MTKKEIFEKYKTKNNWIKCEFCRENKKNSLKIGEWMITNGNAIDICENCFVGLE